MKTTMHKMAKTMVAMKKLSLAVLSLLSLGLNATESQAVQGTLTGCVTSTENRTRPVTSGTGLLWTSTLNSTVSLPRALVRLRVVGGSVSDFFTLTGANGCYQFNWTDSNHNAFPVIGEVSVTLARPNLATGAQTTSAPARRFTITNGPLYFDVSTSAPVTLNANTTKNVPVAASEQTAAYLTADEFYTRVVSQSTTLLNGMNGVFVHTNGNVTGGVTPTANDVFIAGGLATGSAFTVAHELGHVVAWRSLGLLLAPFRADFADYMCDGNPTHSWTSLECEKAAWNEGFAHFAAAAWMWARTAPSPIIPVTAAGFNLESGSCTAPGRQNEGCQAKALWDIYDSRTGDDDGITNRSLVSISQVLRGYPDNCLFPLPGDNNCSNEGNPLGLNSFDFNALNHLDFRANWAVVIGPGQVPQISAIYTQNLVTGGDPF